MNVQKEKINTISSKDKFGIELKEIYYFRELLFFFAWRDIKVKYKQTVLGLIWAILQPVLMAFVFIVFFSRALNIETGGLPPLLFYILGLLVWNLFSAGLLMGNNSLLSNSNIIKKIYFPRIILPISAILVALFDFFIALILFVIIAVYYNLFEEFSLYLGKLLVVFPIGVLIILMTTIGVSTIVGSFNIKYRDFRYIIPYFVQLLFFLSPVVYGRTFLVDSIATKIMNYNPIAGVIYLYRSALTGQIIEIEIILTAFIIALILFGLGSFLFSKTERYIADII